MYVCNICIYITISNEIPPQKKSDIETDFFFYKKKKNFKILRGSSEVGGGGRGLKEREGPG